MANDLGRNDLCWCGSGKKFKKCHMGREEMPRLQFHEMLGRVKSVLSSKYCSHPTKSECSGKIIRAHTIPKGGSLRSIAREGKVYAFKADFSLLMKNDGQFREELVGVNDVSTFTGFCSFHDDKIFAPIEKHPLNAVPEHALLLTYRAICRERFAKQRHIDTLVELNDADRGHSVYDQALMQEYIQGNKLGADEALARLTGYKDSLERMLIAQDFDGIRYYALCLSAPPDVMAAGGVIAEYDFDGHQIQETPALGRISDSFAFSVLGAGAGGIVVFSWVDEKNGACTKFINSFDALPNSDKGDAIIRFLFAYSENLCISPDWWEQLSEAKRDSLRKRVKVGTAYYNLPDSNILRPDGNSYVSWDVSEIKKGYL